MKTLQTPQDQDWNQFWQLKKGQQFSRGSRISWSKRRILNILARYCHPGYSSLDAGCGSGFFAKYFCDRKMQTTALDFSPQALEIAKEITKGQAKLIQADMVNDFLPNIIEERFDLIFSDGLFEHFTPDVQDRIMKNLVAVLKPAGVMITFVPNRWSPWELIRPFFMPGIDEKPFTLKQLLKLNSRNGLSILEKGGINVLPYRVSPEFVGPTFGMLLYTVAKIK